MRPLFWLDGVLLWLSMAITNGNAGEWDARQYCIEQAVRNFRNFKQYELPTIERKGLYD